MMGRLWVRKAFCYQQTAGHIIHVPHKTSCLSSVSESSSFHVTGRDDISAQSTSSAFQLLFSSLQITQNLFLMKNSL